MSAITPDLLNNIRNQFAQIDSCPVQGQRVFFENAGGALTLNSVVNCSKTYAAIPDNQGRDNPGSHELVRVINQAKADLRVFMNALGWPVFRWGKRHRIDFQISDECMSGYRIRRNCSWLDG